MKKIIFAFFLLSMNLPIYSQTQKDVIDAKAITWYGLDFSHAKLIGPFTQFNDAGQQSGEDIRDKYFDAWNKIMINEKDKYDLKKAFKKEAVVFDLETVEKRNKAVDPDKIFSVKSSDKNRLTRDSITEIVKNYQTGKNGIGLVFIVDNFDKTENEGVIYVTFFDTASGKALIMERMKGAPGGFGIRNYWAGAIHSVIGKSRNAYNGWAKKYK